SLVSATVGMLLRMIESRSERSGQFIANLLGMAWSVTTYFVVPVLVVERTGPFVAVRRSVEIMRKTWGESLGATFSLSGIVMLVSLVGVVPLGLGAMMNADHITPIGVVLVGSGVAWIMAVSLISSTLSTILLAALYLYAAEGTA